MEITCYKSSGDAQLFNKIINIGIDSRLEGFTTSKFSENDNRLILDFSDSEMSILLRRLSESDAWNAEQWENDILQYHYGIEVV